MRLILASASPRRADLLRAAGFDFDVRAADVDERLRPGETPVDYVRRLAADKAAAVARGLGDPQCVILGADTVVVVDGAVLGKPRDAAEAGDMLRRLSGRWHDVTTGLCMRFGTENTVDVETSRVQFASLSEEDIAWYVASGEGFDKAGAYAIQGLASRFVPRIEGSYANVVGLPVARIRELLNRFETRYPDI